MVVPGRRVNRVAGNPALPRQFLKIIIIIILMFFQNILNKLYKWIAVALM